MSQNQNHPLPAPPGQQQFPQRPIQQRQRTATNKSGFSFHSHKSSNSGSQKIDLHETHEEKESRRLQSKADPSMAITEAEPSAVARERSSLAPIRAIQHRDNNGNPIADPDRSNPTRSRWERPLDTIRSFEAAIDGGYSRKSYMRTESADSVSQYNRRSSYYGGTQVTTDERPRYPQNGYYGGGRAQSYRPESTYMDGRSNGMTRPDNYYNTGDNGVGPSNGYTPNRARYPRTASEPHLNGGGVYPPNGNPQSYETVTTGSGSSGEPIGYSTDPSSENSSVDRIAPLPAKDLAETYGFAGFGNNPQYPPPGSGLNDQYVSNGGPVEPGNGYQNQGPPPLPRKESAPRVPIKLGMTSGNAQSAVQRPAAAEKRKSWFGKRFSKS